MLNKSELVAFRDGNAEDVNFVYATMLRGLYYGETWFSEIPKQIFMENYHNVIKHLLTNGKNVLRVACLKDEPEVILGYALLSTDQSIVHFSFIKKVWRGIGIARDLVPTSVTTATHLTKTGLSIVKRKGLIFNPFLT